MGRVSRYKRIKACDPFSKRNNNSSVPAGWDGNVKSLPSHDSYSTFALFGFGAANDVREKRKLAEKKRKAAKWGKIVVDDDDCHGNRQQRNKKEKRKDKKMQQHAQMSRKLQKQRKERLQGKKAPLRSSEDYELDAPPVEGDDFKLGNLNGVKKESLKNKDQLLGDNQDDDKNNKSDKPAAPQAHIPQTDEEEARVARILRVQKQLPTTSSSSTSEMISKLTPAAGENLKSFEIRVEREARNLAQLSRKKEVGMSAMKESNPRKYEKRKAFLDKKKKKKRKHASAFEEEDRGEGYGYARASSASPPSEQTNEKEKTRGVTSTRSATFLQEDAERPPMFQTLPRGADKIQKARQAINQGKKQNDGDKEEQKEAQRRAMERLRMQVQANYAQFKAKKRLEGGNEFHL